MKIETLCRIVKHIEKTYMLPENITDDWSAPYLDNQSLVFDYGDDGLTRFAIVNNAVQETMETNDGDVFVVKHDKLYKVE